MLKNTVYILVLAITFSGCDKSEEDLEYSTFSCSAESIISEKGKDYFQGEGVLFKNTSTQTNEEVRSGKYAIKLNKDAPYGLTVKDHSAKPGDFYKISVWRKSKNNTGLLVITGKSSDKLYIQEKHPVAKDENGWELLQVEAFIPPHFSKEEIKIFAWNPHDQNAYFDDITIEKKPSKEYPVYKEPIQLHMGGSDIEKLEEYRKEAYEQGHIGEDQKETVPAILKEGEKKSATEVRLKGDWLDHVKGPKWSFRVKVEDDNYWRRMKEFSLHNPPSRGFLNEWVLHQWLLSEKVLTTRYDFVPLELNGKSLGIYAYEEHFEKQLVESKGKREGALLKISEESFWQWIELIQNKDSLYHLLPMAEAAAIEPFNTNSTLEDPALRAQFYTAQNIILRYKNAKLGLGEVLDLDAFARYYAIADILQAKHGFGSLNLRFYFNPVSQKIEPIAYDGFSGDKHQKPKKIITGFAARCDSTTNDAKDYPSYALFNDTGFVQLYVQHLEKYSDEQYIDSLLESMRDSVLEREAMLQKEYEHYKFDHERIKNNASQVREEIKAYKEKLKDCYPKFHLEKQHHNSQACENREPLAAIGLKAYTKEEEKNNYTLSVLNFHCQPIVIKGYGRKKGMKEEAKEKLELPAYQKGEEAPYVEIEVDKDHNRIYYSIAGSEKLHNFKFYEWPLPTNSLSVREELLTQYAAEHKSKSKIVFSGNRTISKPIVIPAGKEVVFEKGTELDFTNEAFFISFSAVEMMGTADNPITIKSSDGTSMGFSVMEAPKPSIVEHVNFDGLSNLDYKGWLLMGAVNFYQGSAHFRHCKFINNQSEDGLNTISNHFTMENCHFENTFGDAFDADFCEGTVSRTTLLNAGNDGLDFSGSKITIEDCSMKSIGDKAVSVGEDSYTKIAGLQVEKAVFGITAKDLSHVDFSDVNLKDCQQAIAAYQKKPEYGPATLKGEGLETSGSGKKFLLDLNSKLELPDQTLVGEKKIDVDALYN